MEFKKRDQVDRLWRMFLWTRKGGEPRRKRTSYHIASSKEKGSDKKKTKAKVIGADEQPFATPLTLQGGRQGKRKPPKESSHRKGTNPESSEEIEGKTARTRLRLYWLKGAEEPRRMRCPSSALREKGKVGER